MGEGRSFRLHIVNIVLAILFLGFGIVRAFLMDTPDAASAAYEYGRAFGFGFGLCIVAGLGAFVAWFVFGRSTRAGNIAFGALIVFGAIGFVLDTLQSQATDKRLEEYADAMRESRDESAEEIRQVTDDMFGDLIASSSGDERKSYVATREYMAKQLDGRAEWDEAYANFMDDRIMDYAVIESEEEMAFQKAVVTKYVDVSGSYAKFFDSALETMRAELVNAETSPGHIETFMAGFSESAGENAEVTARFLRAHEAYGQEFINLLQLMEANEWYLDEETDELMFASDEADDRCVAIFDLIMELESEVNALSDEVERRSSAAAERMGSPR